MRKLFYPTLFTFLLACSEKTSRKVIIIGEYSFNFPNDFRLIKEKGIDSYIGKIKGDSFWFGFDYGYYSDPLVESEEEYLEKKFWLSDAANQFMTNGVTYDKNNYPKVELLNLRSATANDTIKFKLADFIATCKHDSITFDYPIMLPAKTKAHFIKVDTLQNHLRKIIIAKNPKTGLTGIYLENLSGFNESLNNYLALSMATSNLTKQQQDSVLKIFSTVRFIEKNN